MKRIRQFLESIAYAGMKPGGQKTETQQLKWLGPLRGPVERILSGPAPSDPLYLTNRPMSHKVRSWMLIGIPLLVLIAAIGATLALLEPPEVKPEKQLTAKEVASKLLPNMDKEIKLASNPDIQVVEVSVRQEGGPRLVGIIHNSSAREVAEVQLVLDLTDTMGTQLGGVNGSISSVPPNSNKSFTIPIKQKDAAFALVRDISSK
jgi:hypothetical protein